MLTSLIYGSAAVKDFTEAELLELLAVSEKNNRQLDITGMLLYQDRNFLQVLEGEQEAVEKLYSKIKLDPRHKSVMTIFKRHIKQREFGEWKMSFINLDTFKPQEVSGYTDFLSQPISSDAFRDNPSYAHTFLKNFKMLMN